MHTNDDVGHVEHADVNQNVKGGTARHGMIHVAFDSGNDDNGQVFEQPDESCRASDIT